MTTLPASAPVANGAVAFDAALRLALKVRAPAGRRGRLTTVIFHRVVPVPDPLFPGEPDARRFDEICRWLRAWFNVLPLDEAVRRLSSGSLPERALSISFDDGYADNHDVAMPILRSHGLTAAFFVATGFLDGGRMWNDTIVESVRTCRGSTLDLTGLPIASLGVLDMSTIEARRGSMHLLLGAAKYLPPPARLALCERIAERAGASLPNDLMMTADQVRSMARAGMVVGAHTVTHPILARVDERTAREEMVRSKADLEAILRRPVSLFAYPNGVPDRDYTARDAVLVREAGFDAAVSTASGSAGLGATPYELPRFAPWERVRWRFGARLLRNLFADGRAAGLDATAPRA